VSDAWLFPSNGASRGNGSRRQQAQPSRVYQPRLLWTGTHIARTASHPLPANVSPHPISPPTPTKPFRHNHCTCIAAVGGRVKYILDTTEVVWGSLDASQHTDAAKRLLRAELVHAQLHGSFPQDLLARFPLLRHQWPQVLKFRTQIADAARAALEGLRALQPEAAADALVALSALERLDAAGALQRLLGARRQWLRGRLTAGGAGGDAEVAAALLLELALAVQSTVSQVGALFLAPGPGGAAAAAAGAPAHGGVDTGAAATVLQRAAEESESDASELYFGGAFGLGEGAASPEARAWEAAAAELLAALAPLPRGAAAAATRAWLDEVAGDFASAGLQLLAACASAAELLGVEKAVRQALTAWRPDIAVAPAATEAAAPAGAGRASAQGGAGPTAWDATAQAVLGGPLCVWQVRGLVGGTGPGTGPALRQTRITAIYQTAARSPTPHLGTHRT
jgi:hypothetical protein